MAPGIDEIQSLSKIDAAAYLGIHASTIKKYVQKGIIKPYYLPSKNGTTPIARIRIEDLDRFIYSEGVTQQRALFNPRTIQELPVFVVGRILGISDDAVWMALGRGTLKDCSPESIRQYQIKQLSKRTIAWVRRSLVGKRIPGVIALLRGLETFLRGRYE